MNWAGTRAREAKSRDARTIFLSDVSLDGLAERNNRHLGEMILQGYVIQINAEHLEKPTAILAYFHKIPYFRVFHRSQNSSGFPVFVLSDLKSLYFVTSRTLNGVKCSQ